MSKDIKKALEHCVDWDCGNCPNRDELGSGETVCRGRLLPEVLEYVSDLEVKLSESKKQCQQCKHLNKKIELNIKNKLMAENCELQKQLTEKEKRCEICGSKMILGELGYYCNNDELHPIYQAPNEAKSDYEKITLLKQDYDAMVEREELLRQQLTEKEKQLENAQNLKAIEVADELSLKLSKIHNQDKISFAIEQLEKVKSAFGLINSKLDKVETIKEYIHYIDHQINELKGKK